MARRNEYYENVGIPGHYYCPGCGFIYSKDEKVREKHFEIHRDPDKSLCEGFEPRYTPTVFELAEHIKKLEARIEKLEATAITPEKMRVIE